MKKLNFIFIYGATFLLTLSSFTFSPFRILSLTLVSGYLALSEAAEPKRPSTKPTNSKLRPLRPSPRPTTALSVNGPSPGEIIEFSQQDGAGSEDLVQGTVLSSTAAEIKVEIEFPVYEKGMTSPGWKKETVTIPRSKGGKPSFRMVAEGEEFNPKLKADVERGEAAEAAKNQSALDTAAVAEVRAAFAKYGIVNDPAKACKQEYTEMRNANPSIQNVSAVSLGELKDSPSSATKDEIRCRVTTEHSRLRICANAVDDENGIKATHGSKYGYEIGDNFQGIRVDGKNQLWQVDFPGKTRGDLAFSIDTVDPDPNKASHNGFSNDFMIFPREKLPSISSKDNSATASWDMILPNGEKVCINKETGKTEAGPGCVLTQNSGGGLSMNYTGRGILVQVPGKNGLNLKGYPANGLQTAKEAIIMRNGRNCKVSPDKLWNNRKSLEGAPKFKFPKDEEFMTWVQGACPSLFTK